MRALVAVATAALAPLAVGGVAPSTPLATPRAAHTANLLPSGRVLVAGGCTETSCEPGPAARTTELYDPATGRFAAGPPLTSTRVGHSATRLADGRVLIAGGWDERGLTARTEIYDPLAGSFAPGPPMRSARGGFSATRLRDGRVLFAGGARGASSVLRAEVYDPRTGIFRQTRPLRQGRSAHVAALLPDGRVLLAGGSTSGRVLASAEIFDPRTGRFNAVRPLTIARHKAAAVTLRDGRVLVVGGSGARDFAERYASAELFDARRGRFVRTGGMRAARFKIPNSVTRLPSGDVLVVGSDRTVELYDVRRGRFRTVGRTTAGLSFSTATLLPGGDVLIAGGYDERIEPTRGVWVYGARR